MVEAERKEFTSKANPISALARHIDFFVALALAAVLRRRAPPVGKLTVLDDRDKGDRLRLAVDRPGDDRFNANAESPPGDALGPRHPERAGMRREQPRGLDA